MKKYFFIASMALLAMSLFNSCSSPSGQPKNDAEDWRGLIEEEYELKIKFLEKKLQMAEYYADKGDAKGYQKFLKDLDEETQQLEEDFNDKHKDEFEDIKDKNEYIRTQYQEKLENERHPNNNNEEEDE